VLPAHIDDLPQQRLHIGDWCLDPLAHELVRGDTRRRLPKRLVLVLWALARQPGQTVTRDALLAAAWQRQVVADEVLSRCIAELRQALEDDARAPRYIETLPKTGYRLLVPVSPVTERPSPPLPDTAATADTAAPPPTSTPATDPPTRSPVVAMRHRPWLGRGLAAALILGCAALAWWQGQRSTPAAGLWTATALAREQPFLSEPDWIRQPRYSRDGRWLVYLSEARGGGQTRVWLAPAGGGAAQQLDVGAGRLSGPLLSPDATELAVLARQDGRCELRLLRLPAGPLHRLAECDPVHGSALEWTKDGQLIYTAPAEPGRGSGLRRLDPRRGSSVVLTRPSAADVADSQPRLAADGRLAFLRGPAQGRSVWLLENDQARVLLDSADRMPDLAWTPDARQLLIASNAPGYPALLALDPVNATTTLLGGRGAATLDIAPDGRLLYEQRRYDANLWLHRPGMPAQPLTRSTRYDAFPALSPDGRWLAYASNRDGVGSIWLLALDSGREHRLGLPPTQVWTRPVFSADGRSLLLTRYAPNQRTELVRYELASGRHEVIDPPGAAALGGVETFDAGLVFGRAAASGLQLWLQPAHGPARMIDGATAVSEFRSAGRWLAWQNRGEAGLLLQPLDGSAAPRRILDELGPQQPSLWTLSADAVIYAAPTPEGGQALWRRPLTDGAAERWLDIGGGPVEAGLAVAADGRFAVLTHIDRLETDLLRVPAP